MKKRRKTFYTLLLDNFIWLLVIILFVIASIGVARFFSLQNLRNILYNSSSFAMMVLGMIFVLYLGQMDLSLESTYAFAPAIATLCMQKWFHFNGVAGIFITLGVGALVGLVIGFLTVKLNINSFLLTLCVLMILRGLVNFWIPQGIYDISPAYTFLGEYNIPGIKIPLAIIIVLALYILCHFIVKKTAYGRNLIAAGSNPKAAFLSGINVGRLKIISFTMAGLLAAFGGLLLVGRMGSVTNGMGNGAIMEVFAAAVLGGISLNGGKGKILGAFGGVIFLQAVSSVLNLSDVSPFLVTVIQGVLLLVAVIIENFRTKLYQVVDRL